MAIDGFDYKSFAENLYEQAFKHIPDEFSNEDKVFVTDILLKFAKIAGEALDEANEFNSEQAEFVTQVVAEWTFHKSVDFVKSGIPREFWEPELQRIAMVIFEVAKEGKRQGVDEDTICKGIERVVEKTYKECCKDLKNNNLIDKETFENAINQSSINDFSNTSDDSYEVNKSQIYDLPANKILFFVFSIIFIFITFAALKNQVLPDLSSGRGYKTLIEFGIISIIFIFMTIFKDGRTIEVNKEDKTFTIYKNKKSCLEPEYIVENDNIKNFITVRKYLFFEVLQLQFISNETIDIYLNIGRPEIMFGLKKFIIDNYPNLEDTKKRFLDNKMLEYLKIGEVPLISKILPIVLFVILAAFSILLLYMSFNGSGGTSCGTK